MEKHMEKWFFTLLFEYAQLVKLALVITFIRNAN